MESLQSTIEAAWDNRDLLQEKDTRDAIKECIRLLNQGELRVANQRGPGDWVVNEWVKKAITLYFLSSQWRRSKWVV